MKGKLVVLLRIGACTALACWLCIKLVPIPAALGEPPGQSLVVTDRIGLSLRETRSGRSFSRPAKLEDIPPRVVHAMLAAEDKRFFDHGGVDWLAVGRSVRDAVRHRRIVSGASTISQQLIKIEEPRPRDWKTKI